MAARYEKENNLKAGINVCINSFFSVNLTSCNNTQKEKIIEVGFGECPSCLDRNSWLEFYTGIRASTKKAKTQSIEIFYGGKGVEYLLSNQDEMLKFDLNQMLEFKLTRYVYPSDDDALHNRNGKSEDILVLRERMECFFSEEFNYLDNSIIDNIEVDDLVEDYKEYGVIKYKFVITPIQKEPIKIFIDNNPIPVYSDNSITSYYNSSIDYTIDEQNRISFIEKV